MSCETSSAHGACPEIASRTSKSYQKETKSLSGRGFGACFWPCACCCLFSWHLDAAKAFFMDDVPRLTIDFDKHIKITGDVDSMDDSEPRLVFRHRKLS